jgi:hypothetical protein
MKSVSTMEVRRTIGDIHLFGYTFDSAAELIPGVWTFEIWQEDKKIAEQRFEVTKAK